MTRVVDAGIESCGDNGENAAQAERLGSEIRGVGREYGDYRLYRRIVDAETRQVSAQASDRPRDGKPKEEAAARKHEELQRGFVPAEHAGYDCCGGKLERHQSRGVIDQTLAIDDHGHARGNPELAGDGADSDRVGRRDHRAEGESRRERKLGQQPMQQIADDDNRQQDEAQGEQQYRPQDADQIALRDDPSFREKQRRNEQQEKDFGRHGERAKRGQIRKRDTRADLKERQRHRQPFADRPDQRDGEQQTERDLDDSHRRARIVRCTRVRLTWPLSPA
jgi:hypothetical protein